MGAVLGNVLLLVQQPSAFGIVGWALGLASLGRSFVRLVIHGLCLKICAVGIRGFCKPSQTLVVASGKPEMVSRASPKVDSTQRQRERCKLLF